MISPKRDRLEYCACLKPDVDYRVSKAICFTYSLDFVSLLSAVITLSVSESMETRYLNEEIPRSQLIETLMNFRDKLFVYSDIAQIKKPDKDKEIYSIFDSCIKKFDCKTKKSFHPKFWLVQYENCLDSKAHKYKLLLSSRNLAVSHDWDFGICFG